MKPRLLFYCQHSLGLGHLTRSFALAAELARAFDVVLLNGGRFPPGLVAAPNVAVVDLPPLGMGAATELVSHDASADVDRAKQLRRAMVLEAYRRCAPEVLLIELFPFGRKKFAFELLPLLKTARCSPRPPLTVVSVRDILVRERRDQAHHDDRAAWLCNRYFDAVLAHADPTFAPFEESFAPRIALRVPLMNTGLVTPRRSAGAEERAYHILVSAGGGVVGFPLLATALAAHALLWPSHKLAMRIIAGPFLPADHWENLRAKAQAIQGLTLVRSVPDLERELRQARLSVSQCGYNTALDILQSGVAALLVPFAPPGEDEQLRRAQRLQELGWARVLRADQLDAPSLAHHILAGLALRPKAVTLNFAGAARSREILLELLAARTQHRAPREVACLEPIS